MAELTDLERRALANLPRWRSDDERFSTVVEDPETGEPVDHGELPIDDHLRLVNRYPDGWTLPRAISSTALAARLTGDPHTTDDGGEQAIGSQRVDEVLRPLAERGLCELGGDGWSMTEAGFRALVGEGATA